MPDYIYLLENRLTADQRHALHQVREVARDAGLIVFLTGDAVRDLTSGHAVRDIEVAVHGNALKLKKALEKQGAKIWGEDEASHALYLCFPGTVRVDFVSTLRAEYPKPGKPIFHPASIQEDLRRRDFTANAMAISLNEGSYGLLMDPLNGAADIEARTLRLVSNYGFLEEPAFMIRATRLRARLGWELDPRTQARYENAKEEGVIEHLSNHAHSQELEQIGHEDEGLKVLSALENEGWMKFLFPAWTVAKVDQEKLKALHDLSAELQMQGVHADMSGPQMQVLTAKLPPKDLSALKKQLLRPGFVEEWNTLDSIASGFSKALLAKPNQAPSASFKLFTSYDPEAVLWLGFTSNAATVKERFEQFLKVWPEARQRIPYALMLEMRITPDLPTYNEIVHKVFLELIDGKLTTPEEARAFLEPYSPPAPPPQITIKRSRARRGAEAKLRERSFDDDEEAVSEDADLGDIGGEEEEIDLGIKADLDSDLGEDEEGEEEDEEEGEEEEEAPRRGKKGTAPAKATAKAPAAAKPGKDAAKAPVVSAVKSDGKVKPDPKGAKPAAPPSSKPKVDPQAGKKPAPAPTPIPVKAAKPVPAPKPLPKKSPAKAPHKAPAKPPAKTAVKVKAKPAAAKSIPAKPAAAKKPAAKPAKIAKPVAKKAPAKPPKKR